MKISRRHKKYRMAGDKNCFDCTACSKGRHETCEKFGLIFCGCWRRQHARRARKPA